MRTCVVLVFATLAALVLAAPATAADRDVYHAWNAHDRGFCRLGKTERKRLRAWERTHSRSSERRLLHTLRATRKLLAKVIHEVADEQSSSGDGARGKKYAQRSNRDFDGSLHEFIRSVKAASDNHRRAARRHLRATGRLFKKSTKDERIAKRAFKRAGVKLKKPGC